MQGFAGLGALIAVVEREDCAALDRYLARQTLHRIDAGIGELEHFAGEGPMHFGRCGGVGDGGGREAESALSLGEADEALVPAVISLDELLDREGVEELVGDDKERVVAHGGDLAGPGGRVAAEPLLLVATQ